MILNIQLLVLLLAVVAGVAVLANRLKIPPAILLVLTGVVLVVLEGEGLANDATALILSFAVVAVSLGVFSFGQALGTFPAIVVGEILGRCCRLADA
jgi:NhaP-type Na+/H+ or K+/H+ antiporter